MNILHKIDSYYDQKNTVACCNISQTNADHQLTYRQLVDYSNKFAFYLQNNLKENRNPIIVYGHKNPYMIVCFLACVKSGRAYCPIDISVPLERVKDIIDETNTPLILTTEHLEFNEKNTLNLDSIKEIIQTTKQDIDKSYYVKNEDVFYIIFTSGSTGKPKGVQITLDCLNHFIQWAATLGNKKHENRHPIIINQAPFSFDLSVLDLYLSLYLGGTLWCLDKATQLDFNLLYDSLKQSHANIWVSTPSFANMCLSGDFFNHSLMPNMELFLFCGETLTNQTAEKLLERFPKACIVNTYGPTESTVAVTQINVTREILKKYEPLPVGMPKKRTYVFIVDENGNILDDGKKGEILIVGDTVSIGYFQRNDLTKKSFSTKNIDGNLYRCYRTGDEGYIKDGLLFYCGRIDLQIKLHGYRIEIEDIENNLLKLSTIKSAIVIPIIKNQSVESLAAFVVVDFNVDNKLKASQKLRQELAQFLPTYMIPKRFIFVDSIPMTNNGKANRKKLMEDFQ